MTVDAIRISVVVCTFNRSQLLVECLSRLAGQAGPATRSEVIIVDNNSADDTAEVAQRFCGSSFPFRIVLEKRQGLAHARNRGWREARGKYVAYIDDDARPSLNWIPAMNDFLDAQPGALAFGGPYRAFTLTPLPDWFPRDYGSWTLGAKSRVLARSEYLNGTNMIFQKALLEKLGGFEESLGMRGSTLSYGEETELIMRMHMQGLEIHYCPDIVVEHAVLDYKMSLRWLLASSYRNGRSGLHGHDVDGRVTWSSYLPSLMGGFRGALVALVRARDRHAKARAYRALWPLMWQIGYFVSLFPGGHKKRDR
jgi:glucosyl-dolichyl phosphate glucuronosyltransferase